MYVEGKAKVKPGHQYMSMLSHEERMHRCEDTRMRCHKEARMRCHEDRGCEDGASEEGTRRTSAAQGTQRRLRWHRDGERTHMQKTLGYTASSRLGTVLPLRSEFDTTMG